MLGLKGWVSYCKILPNFCGLHRKTEHYIHSYLFFQTFFVPNEHTDLLSFFDFTGERLLTNVAINEEERKENPEKTSNLK